jgi:hypothetical protein
MVVTHAEGHLRVHVISWKDFALQTEHSDDELSKLVTTVPLGNTSTDASAEISVAVTRMLSKSADQQLAVAWVDDSGGCAISLIGWTDDGTPAVLAACKPRFEEATPEKPVYRLASADLLQRRAEQLVVGYPAAYGKGQDEKVRGCAALMLLELNETTKALGCVSTYAVANAGGRRLASLDLHIAAGVFGPHMGVQVIGAAATLQDLAKGEAEVCCGFVAVLRDRGGDRGGFPQDTIPAKLEVGTTGEPIRLPPIDASRSRLLAFPSDLSGQSVVLGPPKYKSTGKRAQILAIIQAPPYDKRTVDTAPNVAISWTYGDAAGSSVSTNKSWMDSTDTSMTMGIESLGLGLSTATHDSFGKGFDKLKDNSSASNLQFHAFATDRDWVLLYETSYHAWLYPVVSSSSEKLLGGDAKTSIGGEVAVIFPEDAYPRQTWKPAAQFPYRPRTEHGRLFSYVDSNLEGYDSKNLLFNTGIATTVGTKQDSSSITLDKGNMTTNTDARHFSVLNSVSNHATWSGSTAMFEFLPSMNFGLNLGSSHTYSDSKVETTHLTVHTNMSVSISSGSVKGPTYAYEFEPVLYHHDKLGCLMLAWKVDLTGEAWQPGSEAEDRALTAPQVCLIRPTTDAQEHPVFNQFSRSISFEEKNGKVDINVEIFNNSPSPASKISCKFYVGKPISVPVKSRAENSQDDPPATVRKRLQVPGEPEDYLGMKSLNDVIAPLERRTVTLENQPLADPLYVTVQLFMGEMTDESYIYWGVYPPERFFHEAVTNGLIAAADVGIQLDASALA